jgi:orotidine-5'-phosphate decarboxylase
MSVSEKLILAIDLPEHDYALEIIDKFNDYINIFKVGLELFTSCGPEIVEGINKKGKKVFLDLKFHDIPSTVSKAAIAAARIGVHMLNLIRLRRS